MGWTSIEVNGRLKADEVRKIIESKWTDDEGNRMEALFPSIKSNAAYGYITLNGEPVTVLVYAIKKGTKEFAYKEMTESCGPCYYDCPKWILDMVPCPDNEYAKRWREDVLERASSKRKRSASNKNIEVGDFVEYKCDDDSSHGNVFVIESIRKNFKGRRQILGKSKKNGVLYKLQLSRIVNVVKGAA